MPGPWESPGGNGRDGTNISFYALLRGYVVVSPGIRGRGMQKEGQYIGMAPAAICDLKAVVRYLRYNRARIPGDVEKIISNGTSAGGALSALLGATGNHPDYEEYLKEMGAAEEKDHIFAASCYCPITNLEHADMAYEWEFCGQDDYYGLKFEPPGPGETGPRVTAVEGELSKERKAWSRELAGEFPAYVNSLNLKGRDGAPLTLDTSGSGSFREYIASVVASSAQKELAVSREPKKQKWITWEGENICSVNFPGYIKFRTRMKQPPAFDSTSLSAPENELFGTSEIRCRHFTAFGFRNSEKQGVLAEEGQIRRMNPMQYIEDKKAQKAGFFRIRHGSIDRDTSLAISAMLALKLQESGVEVDFAYPWGVKHAGDYDREELFEWMDRICRGQ